MSKTEQKYVAATVGQRMTRGVNQAKEQQDYFFSLFETYKDGLLTSGVSSEMIHQPDGSRRLRVTTLLGDIFATPTYVLEDREVGAAIVFTDEQLADGKNITRKLNVVFLRQEGNWTDSDGDGLADRLGMINQHSVNASIHKALAAKLKANTEYVQSFMHPSPATVSE